MTKPNRFTGLMKRRETDEPTQTDEARRHTVSVLGRPRNGKSSNPEYKQISALIRKDTHREVVRALLDDNETRDVSDLLQDLLQEWLVSQRQP